MKLRVPDDIRALIEGMHPNLRKKIKGSLQTILLKPDYGIFPKDELHGLRSFRVSQFRIVYKISGKSIVDLVAIGPREEIYKETYRMIAKGQSRMPTADSPGRARA